MKVGRKARRQGRRKQQRAGRPLPKTLVVRKVNMATVLERSQLVHGPIESTPEARQEYRTKKREALMEWELRQADAMIERKPKEAAATAVVCAFLAAHGGRERSLCKECGWPEDEHRADCQLER